MTRKLTLTFDNGPTPGITEGVLQSLAERELLATFFVVGQDLTDPHVRQLAQREHAEGHWIGNHTMSHGLPLGRRHDSQVEVAEISAAQEALGSMTHPDKLFRPNGSGSVGTHLLSAAAKAYLEAESYTVALWDIYVRDPHEPDEWVERALSAMNDREWSVLVVHDLPTGAMRHLSRFLDAALSSGTEIVQRFPLHALPIRRGQSAEWVGDVVSPQGA